MSLPPANLHGTAIALGGMGVLIRGPSRSGKSALALSTLRRAEMLGLAAALVADDQVFVEVNGDRVEAVAPAPIRGLIEISGVGILQEASIDRVALDLVVDLCEPEALHRLPGMLTTRIAGIDLRLIVLPARQAGFAADVLVSLARLGPADLGLIDV
ncbi:HPr kinase [Aureimonas sp. SA4125]|uniref:HPr kinase/phosphorylase n=1 Tax=Aureimonas sp. SA4125 TaxID=2826993 RepID=UPI001CC546AA|nr:HPr kinase/phosphorylase [Aureimonas sp. SA4125]BDA87033.1 HPr kinase [Aureimonas sp. SA4125]